MLSISACILYKNQAQPNGTTVNPELIILSTFTSYYKEKSNLHADKYVYMCSLKYWGIAYCHFLQFTLILHEWDDSG